MKPPSKTMVIILIAVIAIFVAIQALLPDKETTADDANLVIVSDTDVAIGSIRVDYVQWDGTQLSESGMNADNSLITRGDELYFDSVSWPAIVTVYADLYGNEILAQLYIEETPESGIWQATLYDGAEGLSFSLESVPKATQ